MQTKKLFIGRKIKVIRNQSKLTQAGFAQTLGISTSYLNLMENNQRHVTATVLMALAEKYSVDIASLSDIDTDRILADLIEATTDSMFDGSRPTKQELRQVALNTPDFAKAFLTIHQAHFLMGNQIAELDSAVLRGSPTPTPYEEVRDFFHYQDNYIHELDVAGEELASSLERATGRLLEKLIHHLQIKHKIHVIMDGFAQHPNQLRSYDAKKKTLKLNPQSGHQTQTFHIAHQIALLEQRRIIRKITSNAKFISKSATDICAISLANYFAGSVIFPYEKFFQYAQKYRHDLSLLGDKFETSIEQVAAQQKRGALLFCAC